MLHLKKYIQALAAMIGKLWRALINCPLMTKIGPRGFYSADAAREKPVPAQNGSAWSPKNLPKHLKAMSARVKKSASHWSQKLTQMRGKS